MEIAVFHNHLLYQVIKMKRIAILIIILLLATNIVVAEEYETTLDIEKGWNLVSIYTINDMLDYDRYYEENNILTAHMYDRFNKNYIRLYPEREQNKIDLFLTELGNVEEGGSPTKYGTFTASSMWINSRIDQQIEFETLDGPLDLQYIELDEGWNFLSVTKEMIGYYIKDIKGTCDIDVIHRFDNNDWAEMDRTDYFEFKEEYLGAGILVKSNNNCILGNPVIENSPPPAIPN